MANYDNQPRFGATVARGAESAVDAGLRAHMIRVYNYMTGGLVLTGLTSWIVANTALASLFFAVDATGRMAPTLLGWVGMIAPVALVFLLIMRIGKMSMGAAQATFWGYAALMGISMATIFFAYTLTSITQVFVITAGTFGAMSLWGYATKRDLTGWGSFLMMGLIGVFLAMIVNMFIGSSALGFAISVIGVLVFTGLTAYDTQKIKEMYYVGDDGTVAGRKAIMGALKLYLDFVNLFLMLLRLFGQGRN